MICRHTRIILLQAALTGIICFSAGRAQAQTFTLTPSKTTAAVGDSVTFTFGLTPNGGLTHNLFIYDADVLFNNAYLAVATPYAETAAGQAAFPSSYPTNNTTRTSGDGKSPTVTYPSGTNALLEFTYGAAALDANISSPTNLGTIIFTITHALPTAGTTVTLGPADTGSGPVALQGGSELVSDVDNPPNGEVLAAVSSPITLKPAAAPEPSSVVALLVGAGLLAVRLRRQTRPS